LEMEMLPPVTALRTIAGVQELGGAPPPEMMGDLAALEAREGGGRPGLGAVRRRPGDDLPDDHKLYVAGLPPVFNDAMLRSMFEPFGEVWTLSDSGCCGDSSKTLQTVQHFAAIPVHQVLHAGVVTDGLGSSRGFGFVHFSDATTARVAREAIDGKLIEGRALTVRLRK
jgi:RNA recognition motif-containing protein